MQSSVMSANEVALQARVRRLEAVQDMVLRTSVIHDWPVPKSEVEIADIALKRAELGEG